MRSTLLPLLLPLLLPAIPARAADLRYEAYAAGINVVDVDARFDVGAERYKVELAYKTVGAFGLVLSSQQKTVVQGRIVGGKAVPWQFASSGVMRGSPRVTQIDYATGQPQVKQLVPANDAEREPVPPDRQSGTVDTLSAMAELMAQVNATGRCDGRLTTFDGRRLAVMESKTAGQQVLEPTGRSSFAGPALRCDFVGRQTGGFMLDEDRERLTRPQFGSAWFAAVTPGGQLLPVRISFRTRWFGDAVMYLVKSL